MKLLAGTIVLMAVTVCSAESLSTVRPQMKQVAIEGSPVDVEEGIEPKLANTLYGLLPANAKQGARPSIHLVPRFPDYYAVAAEVAAPSHNDYGLALYVFQRRGQTFSQVFRSQGMKDSYLLRPTFFAGPDRALVLAEVGDEAGIWGVHAFEITRQKVGPVGVLDAARSDPKQPMSWASPITGAKAEFVDGSYVLWLRGEIHLEPESPHERKLTGIGPHKFILENRHFVPKP